MDDKTTICILALLALVVGGIALGFFSLELIFSHALGAIPWVIFLVLLDLCCHGIERPEDADTKARDDFDWGHE